VQESLVHSRRVSWALDRFALGGAAHVRVGAAGGRVALAQPEGALFFAGEATAAEDAPQTVAGAIESGVRAARQCIATGSAKL
jgi:monoamine oxidase